MASDRSLQTLEVPISGMCCAEEAASVQRAIAALPGVASVEVLLASEKALVRLDSEQADWPAIRKAVAGAGCSVTTPVAASTNVDQAGDFTRRIMLLLGLVFGVVLFVVVVGEQLGLFGLFMDRIPWPLGLALVLVGGYPVFRNVIRAAIRRQVTAHTLMTLGALAAVVVREWDAAIIVVLFMRIGGYIEKFTTERARRAVKDLTAMAPQMARVERDRIDQEVPISEVQVGEVVVVRPGEKLPVDGEVIGGHATVDQAAITGESMPVEVGPGSKVFAATLARLGSLRIRVIHVGPDTTFGRIIKLVEEAEAHRSDVQRIADKFSGYYLPVVGAIAVLTFLVTRNPLATAAVLVVACSCAFALATPVAMLASIGAAAKKGVIIKGGKYIELLAHADVLLIDKTGTLTLGRPRITDVVSLNGMTKNELLSLAATTERYSEHPLAEAVRAAAKERDLPLGEPEQFEALPGQGVRARVNGRAVVVGNSRLVPPMSSADDVRQLEAQGKTLLLVACDGELEGILAAEDTRRPEVPSALADLRALGVKHIELLTGDNERTAAALGDSLGVAYRANLLPQDKITIVKDYQAMGRTVVMVGDGVNDAPALAQADVGIAMGGIGTDVAIEAAHVVLLREDWMLVPQVLAIARRTMKVVKLNIAFTALYNLIGLSLAALGLLPVHLAAAAQSLPDLGILANSSRLLRQK